MSQMIRLKYATTQEFAVGGVPGGVEYTYVRAKVKNIALAKDVQVHYRAGAGWQDIPLSWIANFGDYDVFGRSDGFVTSEFAISCAQAGSTEWDNNGFADFKINNFQNVVGGNAVLNKATARQGTQAGGGFVFQTSWIEGEIYVNNLSFGKRVGIRYTADGWATWKDTDATYTGPATEGTYAGTNGAEVWKFKTPELNFNNASPDFAFAVYYNRLDTGEWFWDDNFSQNYKLSKMEGSTTQ